ncbi:MAG TPA: hypothetical protein VN764_05875, partial [Polyangiaceae bacterium]|nr:hypothetical protein [Polyangiaceae bacterium]
DHPTSGDGDGDVSSNCEEDEVRCAGTCIDPESDRDFCGASADCQGESSGQACGDGWNCEAGQCRLACEEAMVACGAECIQPLSDEEHCGAVDSCEGNDEGQACSADEACVIGTCAAWGDREEIDLGDAGVTAWMQFLTDGNGQPTLLTEHHVTDQGLMVLASRPAADSSWTTSGPVYKPDSIFRGWHDQQLATNQAHQALLVAAEGESTRGGPYWNVTSILLDANLNNTGATQVRPYENRNIDDVAATLADDGTPLVAWIHSIDTDNVLEVRLRASNGDWLTTETWVNTATSELELGALEAATRASNQTLVVWEQSSGGPWELRWRRYANGGWYTPSSSLAVLSDATADLSLITNRKEGVYLSWSERVSGALHLMRYANDEWSVLTLGHPGLAQATEVESVVLDNADLLSLTTHVEALAMHFYSAGTNTWTEGPSLPLLAPATQVQAQADAEGNLFAVYLAPTTESVSGLWGARYDAGSQSWSEAVELEAAAVELAALHVLPTGQALVAWTLPGEGLPFARRFE